MSLSKNLQNLQILDKYVNQSWYQDWLAIQEIDHENYMKYFNQSKLEGKSFRFLRITVYTPKPAPKEVSPFRFFIKMYKKVFCKNHLGSRYNKLFIEYTFQWEHRTIRQHSDNNYKTGFGISATSDPFSDTRPLMVNQADFIKFCLEFGLTQAEMNYFFSKEMEMSDDDWKNY